MGTGILDKNTHISGTVICSLMTSPCLAHRPLAPTFVSMIFLPQASWVEADIESFPLWRPFSSKDRIPIKSVN